jgi:glycosidase
MAHAFRLHLSTLGPLATDAPRRDFHLQKAARQALGADDSFFTARGDVTFPTLERSQRFAQLVNARRVAGLDAGPQVQASHVNAMGLLHEVLHGVIGAYRKAVSPKAFGALRARLTAQLGPALDATLLRFVEAFPPPAVYAGALTPARWLEGSHEGTPHGEVVLEELVLLWLGNQNPAYAPIRGLISDEPLRQDPGYLQVIQATGEHFKGEPGFGPGGQSLLDLLLAPIRHAPDDLAAQLAFMRSSWGLLLEGDGDILRLLLGLDFISEEARWFARRGQQAPMSHDPQLGPQTFAGAGYDQEPEQFSPDTDWMPRVVMLAKSTFVWLDQLRKQYGAPIWTLADIPDAELDLLADRGYTALWLIGLWRRSAASRKIKVINGNPEAVASAYSLYDYEIAPELGGHAAYQSLRERCWRRGLRLASDMVPNHMGVDSAWVMEHPDWFLQTGHPPFPSHTFDGPDLSEDPRAAIQIEDGYWKKTDAAVVFKRTDRRTGEVRFIYHGNDGTSMPWNDTAQLDYLKAEVRHAVLQTILHVARLFPIIRFDAAMTLAKRHYQRLWFPVPGSGGDIPSRAQHAMTKEQFDRAFPEEFWREVVDTVAREVPDTLLLAEAFWMMEGYFVRTLGMHRVYNSAFMHMLKKEDNATYRQSIKNTLEFNPQILKRHVNFMNNPDEETAVAQFGKDDKYFGVCLLLATLPGLPMFGHGQVEGYTERYGMEYQRAYKDERPDEWLVARHLREITPLLRRRWLFADVEGFHLFDLVTPEGRVDEDVYAFSNRKRGERGLVIFNNKYKTTRGRIRLSASFLDGGGNMVQRTLVEALSVEPRPDRCLVFRDHLSGLEHIVETGVLAGGGLELELGAYARRAFLDFREVQDDGAHPWVRLARRLGGAGVPSVDEALLDERLGAIHAPVSAAVEPGSVAYFLPEAPHGVDDATLRRHLVEKLERVLAGLVLVEGPAMPMAGLVERLARRWERARAAFDALPTEVATPSARHLWFTVLVLDAVRVAAGHQALAALRLDRPVATALRSNGFEEGEARRAAELALVVASRVGRGLVEELSALLATAPCRAYLNVHEHGGTVWFDKARFEALCAALEIAAIGGEDAEEVERPEVEADERAKAGAPAAPKPAAPMESGAPVPAAATTPAAPAERTPAAPPSQVPGRTAAPGRAAKKAEQASKGTPAPVPAKSRPAPIPAAPAARKPPPAATPAAPPVPLTAAALGALAAESGYRLEALRTSLDALQGKAVPATPMPPEAPERPGDPEGEA